MAPKANITFYFAPNSFQNFYSVLNTALKHSHVVSCSWDSREDITSAYWASFNALFAKYPNVPLFIATGDQGSNGAVGFPASCPNVISKFLIFKYPNFHLHFQYFFIFLNGCGGTSLNLENGLITSNSTYMTETGWSGSNGGYSRVFARPSYQNGIQNNSKRGVPDLSANADPNSGYTICFANKCMKLGGNKNEHVYITMFL